MALCHNVEMKRSVENDFIVGDMFQSWTKSCLSKVLFRYQPNPKSTTPSTLASDLSKLSAEDSTRFYFPPPTLPTYAIQLYCLLRTEFLQTRSSKVQATLQES